MSEVRTLHEPFRRWLTEQRIAFTYHRPDRATGATLGDPDFVLYQLGKCLMIEFKGVKTPISASQKKRHAELAAAGCTVHVIRDLGAAIALVDAWRGMHAETTPAVAAVRNRSMIRIGNGVWRDEGNGYTLLRAVTPEDAGIPVLR